MLDNPRLGLGELFARQVVRDDPRPAHLGPVEPRAGEREELAEPPRQPREIPAAADIGEQADPGFGHGESRVLGRHAIFGGHRYADPATHGDPVHEGDDRLGVSEELVVELVFVVEEPAPRHAIVVQRRIAEERDVATSAEAAPLGMIDDDRFDGIIVRPLAQRRAHGVAHVERKRVKRLRAVERDMPDRPVAMDEHVVRHWRSMSRPTIIRMTWFVPSRIECTRKSRQKRSIG